MESSPVARTISVLNHGYMVRYGDFLCQIDNFPVFRYYKYNIIPEVYFNGVDHLRLFHSCAVSPRYNASNSF